MFVLLSDHDFLIESGCEVILKSSFIAICTLVRVFETFLSLLVGLREQQDQPMRSPCGGGERRVPASVTDSESTWRIVTKSRRRLAYLP